MPRMYGYRKAIHREAIFICFIWFVNDVAGIFKFAHVPFYADDLKLLLLVRGLSDCLKIQADLNMLTAWCEDNELFLNFKFHL
jgi:hypothetical protein